MGEETMRALEGAEEPDAKVEAAGVAGDGVLLR